MEEFAKESMGERIKSLRSERGDTRNEFARQIGISGKYLYEIETKNKWFSTKILVRMAAEFGVSADYILTGREDPVDSRQFFRDMEKLSPHTQMKMKQLMEIAYELAKEEK